MDLNTFPKTLQPFFYDCGSPATVTGIIITIACTHPGRLGSLTVHLALASQPIVTKKICGTSTCVYCDLFQLRRFLISIIEWCG